MMDEPMVLGWTRTGIDCPHGVTSRAFDGIDLLVVEAHRAPDARSRLRWQVACFDHGIDFVPIAPATEVTVSDGTEFTETHSAGLVDTLAQLKGLGQLSLGLGWPQEQNKQGRCGSGRDWLAQRRKAHGRKEARKTSATTLLDHLECPGLGHVTRTFAARIERDVLLPRDQLTRALSHLRTKARAVEGGAMSLGVSGLWPPFSFAQPFSDTPCPWD